MKVLQVREVPVRADARRKAHVKRREDVVAWCRCGWESPRLTSRTTAMRHLLAHRWVDHDGPRPRAEIPVAYREQELAKLRGDDVG